MRAIAIAILLGAHMIELAISKRKQKTDEEIVSALLLVLFLACLGFGA